MRKLFVHCRLKVKIMNKIWHWLILTGFFISFFTGEFFQMGDVIIGAINIAIKIIFSLTLVMILWNGIFNIAIEAGLIRNMVKIFRGPMKFIFPELDVNSQSYMLVATNLLANILGISSASTPLGLKAMAKLKEEGELTDSANHTMETFVLLNCGSLSFIPLTLVSFRSGLGGKCPLQLYLSYFLISFCVTFVAICLDKHYARKYYINYS